MEGTVPHPILQFDLGSRLHKKPRPEKFKPFPSAARLVTSSRRRVLDSFWTVSLPVISKKKDVPKVSSHWFICRIRGWIYGLVGEYIQLIFCLLTSIGITSIYLGSICTRTSFVLIVLGWIFHSQFLGVFPSGNISKFSRSLNSHVMF